MRWMSPSTMRLMTGITGIGQPCEQGSGYHAIHLLTPEAMDVYLRHLKPGGALLFHVTNRFLDLPPVVRALADARGLVTGLVSHSETDEEDRLHYASTDWMIVTANPALLETPAIKRVIQSVAARPDLRSWSDDFNNLYRILK
jgi:hypothetical protein